MSQTKKRKSDVHNEHTDVTIPKKEKWYDEEQKAKMLSTPLEPTQNTTSRRSSFLHALKRMVSGSAIKEKTRSTSKLSAAQLSSGPTAYKENDHSFASETSQESDHIPADKLVYNDVIRKFVQTGEAPEERVEMDVTSSDTFDTTSSASVLSMVTPSRAFQRDRTRRSSVRSMPENPSTTDTASSTVRRHGSVAIDQKPPSSPLSRFGARFNLSSSFRVFRSKQPLPDFSENRALNTSFAPLAEADESQDIIAVTPESMTPVKSKECTMGASKIFGSSSKKCPTIASPTEIFSISMTATGGDPFDCETPKNTTPSTVSPGSSGLQKRVSSAFNTFFRTTPSPGRRHRVERSKTENPKKDHRIHKRKEGNAKRSSLAPGGLNFSRADMNKTLDNQKREKDGALADLFRKKVHLSSQPVPDVLKIEEFDAVLVDLIDGKPASSAAQAILNFYSAVGEVKNECDADMDKTEIVYKKEGQPFLICINLNSHNMKPLDVRVRKGVGSGLLQVWNLKTIIKRVLVYPMFCLNEEDSNNTEHCVKEFFNMVLVVLEWNSTPENIEHVVLAGLSPAHTQLLKEGFQHFLSMLPCSDIQMADI